MPQGMHSQAILRSALLLWLVFTTEATDSNFLIQSRSTATCPGILPASLVLDAQPNATVCTADCQLATCHALLAFFTATQNQEDPGTGVWRTSDGWQDALTRSCDQLLGSVGQREEPAYCSWYGVSCCNPLLQLAGFCQSTNSVLEIKLEVNGLVATVEGPSLQQSILQLHACGLRNLSLNGNALSGSLTDYWGQLVNLQVLDLGKPQLMTVYSRQHSLVQDRHAGTLDACFHNMDSLLFGTLGLLAMCATKIYYLAWSAQLWNA